MHRPRSERYTPLSTWWRGGRGVRTLTGLGWGRLAPAAVGGRGGAAASALAASRGAGAGHWHGLDDLLDDLARINVTNARRRADDQAVRQRRLA